MREQLPVTRKNITIFLLFFAIGITSMIYENLRYIIIIDLPLFVILEFNTYKYNLKVIPYISDKLKKHLKIDSIIRCMMISTIILYTFFNSIIKYPDYNYNFVTTLNTIATVSIILFTIILVITWIKGNKERKKLEKEYNI